jgi:hypothetical protein
MVGAQRAIILDVVPAFEPVKKSSGFRANCDSMERLGGGGF